MARAASRLSSLRCVWLPSNYNQVADFLYHSRPPPWLWRFHSEVKDMIWQMFSRTEVNLFTLRESTQSPLWFSWIDAFPPLPLTLAMPQPLTLVTLPPPSGGPFLAGEALVSTAAEALLWLAKAPPRQEGSPVTADRPGLAPQPWSSSALGLATAGPTCTKWSAPSLFGQPLQMATGHRLTCNMSANGGVFFFGPPGCPGD